MRSASRSPRPVIFAAALAALTACAGTPPDRAEEAQRLYDRLTRAGLVRTEEVNRVPNFRIRGWRDLDERHLILTLARDERYLVTFNMPCRDLPFASGVALDAATSGLARGDAVIVDGPGSGPRERCLVGAIHRLEAIEGYVEPE